MQRLARIARGKTSKHSRMDSNSMCKSCRACQSCSTSASLTCKKAECARSSLRLRSATYHILVHFAVARAQSLRVSAHTGMVTAVTRLSDGGAGVSALRAIECCASGEATRLSASDAAGGGIAVKSWSVGSTFSSGWANTAEDIAVWALRPSRRCMSAQNSSA